jgi:hypothetical protein
MAPLSIRLLMQHTPGKLGTSSNEINEARMAHSTPKNLLCGDDLKTFQ